MARIRRRGRAQTRTALWTTRSGGTTTGRAKRGGSSSLARPSFLAREEHLATVKAEKVEEGDTFREDLEERNSMWE